MIELLFTTPDTDVSSGRATVMGALNARAQAVGLGSFFPAGQSFPGMAPDVPTSALAALLTAPQRAALAGDFVRINLSDGLLTFPGSPNDIIRGYRLDMLVALRNRDVSIGALGGILSQPWTSKADTNRAPTSSEAAYDPTLPGTLTCKVNSGVSLWPVWPGRRPHSFLGAP